MTAIQAYSIQVGTNGQRPRWICEDRDYLGRDGKRTAIAHAKGAIEHGAASWARVYNRQGLMVWDSEA